MLRNDLWKALGACMGGMPTTIKTANALIASAKTSKKQLEA